MLTISTVELWSVVCKNHSFFQCRFKGISVIGQCFNILLQVIKQVWIKPFITLNGSQIHLLVSYCSYHVFHSSGQSFLEFNL